MSPPPGRPRLLLVGDGGVPTGYTRVLRGIFEPLADRYELHQLATRYESGDHDTPWPLHPAADESGPYGFARLPRMVDELRPNAVFVLYDVAYQGPYLEAVAKAQSPPPTVIYSPVESGPIEPEALAPLAGAAAYVVYTRYAAGVVERARESAGSGAPGPPPAEVIPHGVDTATFHPLADDPDEATHRARRELFGDAELDDAFLVLNGNRNLPKKRMDVTLRGFARFAEDKPPNVRLFLHTQLRGQGWNLPLLARRLGLLDRLVLTTDQDGHPDLPSERLNLVYNACDVGLNTSANEGWGLVSLEHAATRRPQVVPGHSCLPEIWGDAALLVEPATTFVNLRHHTDSWLLSPEGVAEALERLYRDPELRREMAERALRRATDPELSWSSISRRFDDVLRRVLG